MFQKLRAMLARYNSQEQEVIERNLAKERGEQQQARAMEQKRQEEMERQEMEWKKEGKTIEVPVDNTVPTPPEPSEGVSETKKEDDDLEQAA